MVTQRAELTFPDPVVWSMDLRLTSLGPTIL